MKNILNSILKPITDNKRVYTTLDVNDACFHQRGNFLYIGVLKSQLEEYITQSRNRIYVKDNSVKVVKAKRLPAKMGKAEKRVQETINDAPKNRYSSTDPFVVLHVITVTDDMLEKFVCGTVRQLEEKIRKDLGFIQDPNFDGDEWWQNFDAPDLIEKIQNYLFDGKTYNTYFPRIPQQRAINKIKSSFADPKIKDFLLGAIMRFGKNFTWLWSTVEILEDENKEEGRMLVFTNRPGVFVSLKNELTVDSHIKFKDYEYIDSNKIKSIKELPKKCVVALSKQLLDHKENDVLKLWILEQKWDFIIIDEAHNGIETPNAQSFLNKFKSVRKIFISGTPQKQLGKIQFGEVNRFIYDEIDQKKDYEDGIWPNAVILKTKLIKLTKFHIDDYKSYIDDSTGYFSFNKFFQVRDKNLIYKTQIIKTFKKWFGYDRDDSYNFFSEFNHVLILLPSGVDAIKNLKTILMQTVDFNNDYEIIAATGNDFKRNELVKALQSNKKTITLTSEKLIEGETVPEWDCAINMSDGTSPFRYLQFAFRPTTYNKENPSKEAHFFDLNPQRNFIVTWTRATLNGLKGLKRDEWIKNYYKNFNIFYGSEKQNFSEVNFDILKKDFYELGNLENSFATLLNFNDIDISILGRDLSNLDGISVNKVEINLNDNEIGDGLDYSINKNEEESKGEKDKDDDKEIKQKFINILTKLPWTLLRRRNDSVEELLKETKKNPQEFESYFFIKQNIFEKYWYNSSLMDKDDIEYHLKNYIVNLRENS